MFSPEHISWDIPARKQAFFNGSRLFTASCQKYIRDSNKKITYLNKRETLSERKTFLDVARCLLTFTLTTPILVRELRLKPPGDYSNSLSYGFKAVRVLHIYQGMLSNPHQLITKIIIALLWNIIYLQCFTRSTVISRQVLKDGLLSLDSQTAMARVGCATMVDGGMTNKL